MAGAASKLYIVHFKTNNSVYFIHAGKENNFGQALS